MKRPDQKDKLTDLAKLQSDPGQARDKGKSQLTGKGSPRPNKAGK
jgi:hypothetical protein